ncbi:MAG: Uncharacterized protein FD123_830 [Bacteroidetes bacterium]|nr:MAG: Uncharacterized protein FD123_830 [Bacteroidota bacterium]
MAKKSYGLTGGLDSKNWIQVKLDDGSKTVSIAKYTRVKNLSHANGRESFTIIDWPYAGKKASVKEISSNKSRFTWLTYESGGVITFDKSKKQLKFGGSKAVKTYTDPDNEIKKGTYKIWVPDYPHPLGDKYIVDSVFATIWFRLGDESSSRYLHVGNVSAGCVSVGTDGTAGSQAKGVHQRAKYTEIAKYLLLRRKNDKHCGILKVI